MELPAIVPPPGHTRANPPSFPSHSRILPVIPAKAGIQCIPPLPTPRHSPVIPAYFLSFPRKRESSASAICDTRANPPSLSALSVIPAKAGIQCIPTPPIPRQFPAIPAKAGIQCIRPANSAPTHRHTRESGNPVHPPPANSAPSPRHSCESGNPRRPPSVIPAKAGIHDARIRYTRANAPSLSALSVIPAKAGIHRSLPQEPSVARKVLDSRFRGNDGGAGQGG